MKITPIRLRRMSVGLETNEVKEALGISKSAFYKIEQGYLIPSPELLKRMSDIYCCSTDDIFKDLNITGWQDKNEVNISNKKDSNSLSPVERKVLEKRIKELEKEVEMYKTKIENAKIALG
ncbi:helix-turn-helix domain-containing protein [Clostridium beijerinckii]|uniref:Transcriptional regulator with XRE-family HTH domain n=1 Tax=Clostridium beijerinckii TaxID=1520 RepID=A0AAX0B114_CLOBE|nr:transcriptional regulator with XRE-family HTH domain [Clostridium beijerinckii]NYC74176.1 transcriptional regulator with XRE-family HTH domain [Clostridium beijerinckii]